MDSAPTAPALFTISGRAPGSPAIDDGRRKVTWSELEDRTNAIGNGVSALGLVPGSHVVLVAGNRAEFYEALIGVQRAGMVVSPLKTTWSIDEIEWVLNDARTVLVVTDCDTARQAAHRAGIPLLDLDADFDTWIEGQSSAPHAADLAGWRMPYTSGTTGRPKGVWRDNPPSFTENFRARAQLAEQVGISGEGDHLMVSQAFHGAPLAFSLGALSRGASIRLLDRWSPETALDLLREHSTSVTMVPTMFRQLLALPTERRDGFRARDLRTVVHGGEPCPVELKRKMIDWWGPIFVEYFGFTEGGMTTATTEEWLSRPGTVGRPSPLQHVRILGDDDETVPARTVGRVYFGSTAGGRRFSYLNDPDKTNAAHVGDLVTAGDIGWLDDDGYLYLCGRSSDVMVCAGVNVYPAEIEAVLEESSSVVEVAVVGGPDPERGEQPVAFVVATPDADESDVIRELEELAATRMAGYKRPRRHVFMNRLPRDPTGKLVRSSLRDTLWGRRSSFAVDSVPEP